MKALLDRLRRPKKQSIPDMLWHHTCHTFPFLAALNAEENKALRNLCEGFLEKKEFTTVEPLTLTDEMCVAIAAQGCLPILRLGLGAYDDWVGIVIYPDEFIAPRQIEDETGIVHEYDDVLSGEAWPGGPVVISWRDVTMSGNGYNVVLHEFVHKLDMLNGEADGVPPLHSSMDETHWCDTLGDAYADFCWRVDHDEAIEIDPYASESPAEFFAVCSECFFEIPGVLQSAYPALYDLFVAYYRQDPLSRLTNASTAANTADA